MMKIIGICTTFVFRDSWQIKINLLVITAEGDLLALDAKN